MRTVKISQGVGDMLASIPYIKMLGGEFLYMVVGHPNVPEWHPVNHGGTDLLIPFLRSQGLDGKTIAFKDQCLYTYDIDMDARIQYGWPGQLGDIFTWNSLFYGVYPDMTKPFFNIGPVDQGDYILFARTARYNNPCIDYTYLNHLTAPKKFIGTKNEFDYLHKCFPKIEGIEFYQIKDYLDAAKLMKGAKLFISNQTSFASLAEGLGVKRVLEVCPGFPSIVLKTPGGRPVLTQRFFERAIRQLLDIGTVAGPRP